MSGEDRRLFIFGWDGADWEVIHEGWRRGRLPNLRSIVERGQAGTLLSTIPPETSCAWTSFLTGVEPGGHGIFGFRAVNPQTYEFVPVPGGARRVPTLISRLDRAGIRTCLVTVPWTYPAEPLSHGAIVPGWDAPDEGFESCHPAEIGAALANIVPRIPRGVKASADTRTYLRNQARDIDLRERIASYLMERLDPQLFMMVFTEPDRAGHHFWTKGSVPEPMVDAYDQVDAAMGRLLSRFVRTDDLVLVLSDHGTWPWHTFVHIAPLLASRGWLVREGNGRRDTWLARGLKRHVWLRLPTRVRELARKTAPVTVTRNMSRAVRESRINWDRTAAFPLGDEAEGFGICINTHPPYARGVVGPAEYEHIREEIIEFLSGVVHPKTGVKVFDRVARREEVYSGSFVNLAADIILVPVQGYGVRDGLDFTASFSRAAAGGHRMEGMYALNDSLALARTERIERLLPMVLSSVGHGLDSSEELMADSVGDSYSSEEAREIEARLKALGYIE